MRTPQKATEKVLVSARMRVFSLLVFIFPLFVLSAPDWDKAYDQVCRVDRQCTRLKVNGKWLRPPTTVQNEICKRRELIIDSSSSFDIDPTVMTSCLLAEHTLLVNAGDSVIDLLARLRIYGNPSIGFVQMRMSTARMVARDALRMKKNDDELIADLLNDATAFDYMAALIAHDQKVFRKNGIDIGGDAGILCSLYLIGSAKERAARHKANGTSPQMNHYGLFAARYFNLAEKILSGACALQASH